MNNIERLYYINANLKNLLESINNFNIFDDIRFTEEVYCMARQIQIMKDILEDMKGEK